MIANFPADKVHLGLLLKFKKLKNCVLTGATSIKGLPQDELVSKVHNLHDLIRGLYKPKGWESVLSYLATEKDNNYGQQIKWIDKEAGQFSEIIVRPPNSLNDKRALSDIKATRFAMENKYPIGILYNMGKGINKSLGLGVISKETSDGNFIVLPADLEEVNLMSEKNYFSFRTNDPKLVSELLSGKEEFEFGSISNHYELTKEEDVVFFVLGGDKPQWETGLRAICTVSKGPFSKGYDSSKPNYYRVKLKVELVLSDSVKREDLIPYPNTYNMTFIGPMTKGEPNQANSLISNKKQVYSLVRALLDTYPDKELQITSIFGLDIVNEAKEVKEILIRQDDLLPKLSKKVRSWSKPNNIPGLIGRKKVDKSIFNYGSHIPSEFIGEFEKANGGFHLGRGNKKEVTLLIQDVPYKASLTNIDRKEVTGDTLQLRYDPNKELRQLLAQKLKSSYGLFVEKEGANVLDNDNETVIAIDQVAESLDFYETGEPFIYRVEIITNNSFNRNISPQKLIQHLKSYVSSKGFIYSESDLKNFYLSLKAKPFVILAGISGTGKTKLVRLFSEAIGATKENGRYNQIAVRPDWNDSSDLLGYNDINGKFKPGPLTTVIKKANEDLSKPFIVCLDEMNLSRVEYYFSDFLSLMETRDQEGFSDVLFKPEFFSTEADVEAYSGLRLPPNLYIIGTVNMDETTFPFSKKVLDRANTIEFSTVNLTHLDAEVVEEVKPIEISNDVLKPNYYCLKDCRPQKDAIIRSVVEELQNINTILEEANLHIGYRVRDEVCFYMIYNHENSLLNKYDAFDYQLMQKILPRVQGSNSSILKVLKSLFKLSTGKDLSQEEFNMGEEALKYIQKTETVKPFPRTAKKVATMLWRFEDGFTSFWA